MKVAVAMSGGVDSSVAAALLVEQGHDVVGLHMKLHEGASSGGAGRCCGVDDALDARAVAERLGIPFYVLNLQEAFRRAVVDDLVRTYAAGRTPNPCIRCNGVLKYRVLLARATALDATHLATGHYCRIQHGVGPGPALRAARDADKDQSYFLFPIEPTALERALFPLGDLRKDEVRAHAHRLGLATASKPESQEICFIPDDDHGRFVSEHTTRAGAGDIVDEAGRVLGQHAGFWRYTVGQRRGLGVSLGAPAWVVRVEPDTRRVVVTTDPDRLAHRGLVASDANWFRRPEPTERVSVRVRHRGALVPCTVGPGEPLEVGLLAPLRAVAPGQAAVFYAGDTVLGGAWIERAVQPSRVVA